MASERTPTNTELRLKPQGPERERGGGGVFFTELRLEPQGPERVAVESAELAMRRFAPQSPSFRFELRSFYADVVAVIAAVKVAGASL